MEEIEHTLPKMKLARVFPRKTAASPDDELAFFGPPPAEPPEVDEVHISVVFSYDIQRAQELAAAWRPVGPVMMGGPAIGTFAGEFTPGMYLQPGYTITSRGCPNKCWFCEVPRNEGGIRELEIQPGHNVLDSNLLACSAGHISRVFDMLKAQKELGHDIVLSGGLEAERLDFNTVTRLWDLRPNRMFFAYDTPNDYEPLRAAGKMLRDADFTRRHLYCYVLIGYRGDTFEKAERRLKQAWCCGFMPMAMLYRDFKSNTEPDKEWKRFQRTWARAALIRKHLLEKRKEALYALEEIPEL